MSQQHINRLIESLESQGCRVRETKGGWFIYCPDGKHTLGIHSSKQSDMRTLRNVRASVIRAGLEWPSGVMG